MQTVSPTLGSVLCWLLQSAMPAVQHSRVLQVYGDQYSRCEPWGERRTSNLSTSFATYTVLPPQDKCKFR